jgi:amino acid transporter
MMNLMKRKAGQANMVVTVIAIVTVVIMLFISLLVVSKVRSSISQDGWSAEENTSFTDVKNNSSTAFTLMAIALIVLVAFLIISILRGGA